MNSKRPRGGAAVVVATWDKPSQEAMDAYNVTLVQAIREKNIEALRTMLKDGKSLDACNRFGESILAMACRRGDVETVRFLVSEAKVKVSVRDDFGRLPHHDCCWTPVPNFRAMDVLLQVSPPELLISQDVRGHTPFHYARREHWDDWLHFLEERSDKIVKALNELTPKAEATAATTDETTTKASGASTTTGPATAALAAAKSEITLDYIAPQRITIICTLHDAYSNHTHTAHFFAHKLFELLQTNYR